MTLTHCCISVKTFSYYQDLKPMLDHPRERLFAHDMISSKKDTVGIFVCAIKCLIYFLDIFVKMS